MMQQQQAEQEDLVRNSDGAIQTRRRKLKIVGPFAGTLRLVTPGVSRETVRELDWTPVLESVRAKLSLKTDVSFI